MTRTIFRVLSTNVLPRAAAVALILAVPFIPAAPAAPGPVSAPGLWKVYDEVLAHAKYVDLTHTITPSIPVWKGFGPSKFAPAINPQNGGPYRYDKEGFEATQYSLSTDQFGTQLDPPAHWAPEYPAIDELPPTFAVRPLAVISIVEQVRTNPGYHLQVSDVQALEIRNVTIPAGSV